ncbi:unnamed protein product [Trifolium pratense]|uniref:Uncharacterized protein n=1 Tax=Trifolium pratense TaxID=57577 RepID=A0ACB0JRE6_TRIPR|nr:unnamed protein product [Trifolium pratense]
MASQVKFSLFAIFFIVLAMVVAAHNGHHHHMSPAEAPSSYASSLNYHSALFVSLEGRWELSRKKSRDKK